MLKYHVINDDVKRHNKKTKKQQEDIYNLFNKKTKLQNILNQ